MNSKHHIRWAMPFALLLLTALIYWPGLSGGFLFDDFPTIVTNERVHADSLEVRAIDRATNSFRQPGSGRPLAMITLAVDHAIAGLDAAQYKRTNLLIHLANLLLVFLLLRRLPAAPGGQHAMAASAAFAVALLWAIHPMQVSTVLYVVQRMEMLAMTPVLLALMMYLSARRRQIAGRQGGWPLLMSSGLIASLGLLSKETAALFPAYTLAMELTVLGFAAQTFGTRRALRWSYGFGIALGLLVFLLWVFPAYTGETSYLGRNFTWQERVLTQLRVLPMYLGQMLFPLPGNLTFYYDNYPVSHGLLQPVTTLLGGIGLASLLAATLWLRKRFPVAALGILWFFAAHLLSSNVVSLELVFEHRNYFALAGVLITLTDLIRRVSVTNACVKPFAVSAAVTGFAILSLIRVATWGAPLTLATDLAARNPQSPRAASDLATLYMGMADFNPNSPFYEFGKKEFERAALLPGASPLPEQGLILMASSTNQPVHDEWWESMLHKLRTQPIGPQQMLAVGGLLKQRYEGLKLNDEMLAEAYKTLVSRRPLKAHNYVQYGDHAATYLDDDELSAQMFVLAMEHTREDPAYAAQVISALLSDGRVLQATRALERADQLGLISAESFNVRIAPISSE